MQIKGLTTLLTGIFFLLVSSGVSFAKDGGFLVKKTITHKGESVPVTVEGDPFSDHLDYKVKDKAGKLKCAPTAGTSNSERVCKGGESGIDLMTKCNGGASDKPGESGGVNCTTTADKQKIGESACTKNDGAVRCRNDNDKAITSPKEACDQLTKTSKEGAAVGCVPSEPSRVHGDQCDGKAYDDVKFGLMVVTGLDLSGLRNEQKDAKKKIDDEKLKAAKDAKKDGKDVYQIKMKCQGDSVVASLNQNGHSILDHTCKAGNLKTANATLVFLQHDASHWSGYCETSVLNKALGVATPPTQADADKKWDDLKKQDGKNKSIPIIGPDGKVKGTFEAKCNEGEKDETVCTGRVLDSDGKVLRDDVKFKPNQIETLKESLSGKNVDDTMKELQKRKEEEEKKRNDPVFHPSNNGNNNDQSCPQGTERHQGSTTCFPKQPNAQQPSPNNNRPQQNQQQQQQAASRPVPAPYCAGVNAERSEITAGQSVLIRFSMPYAYSYELRGGPGSVQQGGAIVKPSETTVYYIVGKGAPGAGQTVQGFGTGFDQQGGFYQQPQQQQNAQCQVPAGQACCGPVTITVNQRVDTNKSTVIQEEPDDTYKDLTPEITCAPESITEGRSVTVLWKCPADSLRSVGKASHVDGSILSLEETFSTNRVVKGKSKKLYPTKKTEYAVTCISNKGQKSQTATCKVSINPPVKKQPQTPVISKTPTKPSTQSASSQNELRMSITAKPLSIRAGSGEEVHVEWRSQNAETCHIEGPSGFSKDNTLNDSVDGSADSPGDLEFVFTCTPKGGGQSQEKRVKVVAS